MTPASSPVSNCSLTAAGPRSNGSAAESIGWIVRNARETTVAPKEKGNEWKGFQEKGVVKAW